MRKAPLIAITTDIDEPKPDRPRADCSLAYADAVVRAGGMPVFLAAVVEQIGEHVDAFDGFVLTGGDDPRMEMFGEPTHAAAKPVHPRRQAYEVALIRTLLSRPDVPVLGICLGMQMLALVSGGKLDQHLPDHLESSEDHRHNRVHEIRPSGDTWLATGPVTSSHRQAVTDPGAFRVAAVSHDGVVEAIARPGPGFCLGVQWHPERTDDARLGDGVFAKFVAAAKQRMVERVRA
jgi:putative glutamine amidotransferase